MTRQDVHGAPGYRTIDEARTIEAMLARGWVFEVRANERAAARLEARAALDRLVALGLPHARTPDEGRLFDPVEVLNFMTWAGINRGDPAWLRCVDTYRRLVSRPSLAATDSARYAVSISRTFNLEDRRPGERVRLRLPLPLEDATLGDVKVDFVPPPRADFRIVLGPARLDALISVPESRSATIGVTASFTARVWTPIRPAAALDPPEVELYTRANEGLIRITDRVRALAAELAGNAPDARTKVHRFWDYMMDELSCGMVHYDAFPPGRPLDGVLESGWFDCQVGSALFVALCRARQIPARIVSGYTLHRASHDAHTWFEVWFDGEGWVPFDLGSWGLSDGGRDAAWRDHYFGRTDHRLAVERPPRLFNGSGQVRLPRSWHMLLSLDEPGNSVAFHALDTGALVWREHIEVERLE
ncbi:MAG: transglutaminase family protein [Caulobacterales bacterium]